MHKCKKYNNANIYLYIQIYKQNCKQTNSNERERERGATLTRRNAFLIQLVL